MTLRDYNHLKSENQKLRDEIAGLRKSLVHLSKGGKLDNVTGEPLGRIYLSIVGMGNVSIHTAMQALMDEDSTITDYCIAEAAYHALRQYHIPAGMGDESTVYSAIYKLHESIQPALHDLVMLWKACGGSLTEACSEWLQHTAAFQVLKNKGHQLALTNTRRPQTQTNKTR